MIIHTDIKNISRKLWTDYFVAIIIYPHHYLSFYYCIKKIAPALNMVETDHFQKHKWSYYDAILSICKNTTLIKQRELISIIDRFAVDNTDGKSP